MLEGRGRTKKGKAALVVATKHDRATKQLYPVAKAAQEMFENAGYQGVAYYAGEATCEAIFLRLLKLGKGGVKVTTGFLAAHGSDKGLHDRTGKILIDSVLCEQLTGAILVVASCLCGGELPKRCVKNSDSVKACIGFRGRLWVPVPKWWSKLLTPSVSRRALDDFTKSLLEPLVCLLAKRSVRASTERARWMWSEKARLLSARDKRVAWVFEMNGLNLDFWGRGSVRLL